MTAFSLVRIPIRSSNRTAERISHHFPDLWIGVFMGLAARLLEITGGPSAVAKLRFSCP